MPNFVFFRQKRQDGGIHTGLDWENDTQWESFEPGETEGDPVLEWWVDLRGEGPEVPDDPEELPDWLRRHGGPIRDGFAVVAEELRAGIDAGSGSWPVLRPLPPTIPGTQLVIGMSALRRVNGREVPNVMNYVAEHWEELIARLRKPVPVTWETVREHAS